MKETERRGRLTVDDGLETADDVARVLLGVLARGVANTAGRLKLVELSAGVLLALLGGFVVGEVGLWRVKSERFIHIVRR